MNARKLQFEKALDIYVEQVKTQTEVVGIIASGSFAHASLDKHSDIDVYIILEPGSSFRERGNTWISGIEIEYFYNPPNQIRAYFIKERGAPHSAHMLAHGIVKLNRHEIVDTLIAEAREVLDAQLPPMSDIQLELAKYHLDDARKDYWDCLDNNDLPSAQMIASEIIQKCISLHFQLRRQFPQKNKRLLAFLQQDDPEFERILRMAIRGNCNYLDEKSLLALISHTETRLGGARSKEWMLRSELDLV